MPGLRPTPPDDDDSGHQEDSNSDGVSFAYMRLWQNGFVTLVMDFREIIRLIDDIINNIEDDAEDDSGYEINDETTLFHLIELKTALERRLQDGN